MKIKDVEELQREREQQEIARMFERYGVKPDGVDPVRLKRADVRREQLRRQLAELEKKKGADGNGRH